MAENITWQANNTLAQPNRRRAALVCTLCHGKKIKCDLQIRRQQGFQDCSYCCRWQRHCQLRAARRTQAQTKGKDNGQSRTTAQNNGGQSRTTAQNDGQPRPTAQNNGQPRTTAHQEVQLDHDHPSLPGPSAAPANLAQYPEQQLHISVTTPLESPLRVPSVHETQQADLDTGFLHVYGQETHDDAHHQALSAEISRPASSQTPAVPSHFLPIFGETYFENCYAWCPVLDRHDFASQVAQSPLLATALALAASHVKPPILPHDGPAAYYDRARRMFYEDEEPDVLACLKSILLFYWWAPRSPAVLHRHSSWWWTSVVIRHAQVLNMHRETAETPLSSEAGLRRRIWWTAFARERLTALCQSKPVIINPDDCNIAGPTLDDFPDEPKDRLKAEVFILWVKLCGILGDIAHHLTRTSSQSSPFPRRLANELITWITSLPTHLVLPIASTHTVSLVKDVHQLHLPYLTAITVLHLKRSPGSGELPQALPSAIVAASCTARIFRDILARGDTRWLMPITSWYSAVSFIALLSASQDPTLAEAANEDLEAVTLMCRELSKMWASADVICKGFNRLRDSVKRPHETAARPGTTVSPGRGQSSNPSPTEHFYTTGSLDWAMYFPFATAKTSKLTGILLASKDNDEFRMDGLLPDSSLLDLHDWFTQLGESDFMLSDHLPST